MALCAVVTVTMTGCLEGRDFHHQDRLNFVEPFQDDFVQAPVQLRWTDEGSGAARYVLFVDRAPIAPKQSIEDLDPSDRGNIYESTTPELLLEFVPPRSTSVASRRDRHRLVLIAVDDDGIRLGDESASLDLTVVPAE
jgi:hypothetical protein